jgi:hypothetical protein
MERTALGGAGSTVDAGDGDGEEAGGGQGDGGVHGLVAVGIGRDGRGGGGCEEDAMEEDFAATGEAEGHAQMETCTDDGIWRFSFHVPWARTTERAGERERRPDARRWRLVLDSRVGEREIWRQNRAPHTVDAYTTFLRSSIDTCKITLRKQPL